jgi:hypothetical protein
VIQVWGSTVSSLLSSASCYLDLKISKFEAPASNVIKYETRVFPENFVNRGPYMGREEDGLPTAETDALWEDLYECMLLQHGTFAFFIRSIVMTELQSESVV